MNLMKFVCAIFTLYQNIFCCFFQASEKGKSEDDNENKTSCATYCSRAILDSSKQTKSNFGNENLFTFSQLFLLLSNLFLNSQNKLSQKYPPHRQVSPLKKDFEKCKPVSIFSMFCGTLF